MTPAAGRGAGRGTQAPRAATAPHRDALRRAMSRARLPLLLLIAAAAANAQRPADLEQLAKQVEAAHRTADAKPIESFRADLRLKELARDAAEHRGELELSVSFLEWVKPDTGRPYPLIRYRQRDSARSVEQGRDRVDYWSFADGKQQDMRSRELATDLEHCRRNLKLARQMLQFVDPANVLRKLTEPSAIGEEDFVQGRAEPIPCFTVSGKLAAFPVRRHDGDDVAVATKIYVAKDDHRLVGLQATPLDADGEPLANEGEFLLFSEPRQVAGRLVPMRIDHFAIDAEGKRRAQMRVEIAQLELDKKLAPEDFDRPK